MSGKQCKSWSDHILPWHLIWFYTVCPGLAVWILRVNTFVHNSPSHGLHHDKRDLEGICKKKKAQISLYIISFWSELSLCLDTFFISKWFSDTGARLNSKVRSTFDCRFRGRKFESQFGCIISMAVDQEIISKVICPPSTYSRKAVVSYWWKSVRKYWLTVKGEKCM